MTRACHPGLSPGPITRACPTCHQGLSPGLVPPVTRANHLGLSQLSPGPITRACPTCHPGLSPGPITRASPTCHPGLSPGPITRACLTCHPGLSPGPYTRACPTCHRGLSPGPVTRAYHRGLSLGPITRACPSRDQGLSPGRERERALGSCPGRRRQQDQQSSGSGSGSSGRSGRSGSGRSGSSRRSKCSRGTGAHRRASSSGLDLIAPCYSCVLPCMLFCHVTVAMPARLCTLVAPLLAAVGTNSQHMQAGLPRSAGCNVPVPGALAPLHHNCSPCRRLCISACKTTAQAVAHHVWPSVDEQAQAGAGSQMLQALTS